MPHEFATAVHLVLIMCADSRNLDSKSFFDRLLLAKLNYDSGQSASNTGVTGDELSVHLAPVGSGSGSISPLKYMIGCYER